MPAESRIGEVLGLIVARSGSVGVPGKNIRPLAGRPLIVHTIEAARHSRLSRVVVSTDSEAYAAIARDAGADCPFLRPAAIASGTARSIDIVRHALDFFARQEKWTPEAVFYLQPTSPFRSTGLIDQALDALRSVHTADSVMSVSPMRDHPSFGWVDNGGGRLVPLVPLWPRPERRQDVVPVYVDNNAVMLSRTRYLLGDGPHHRPIINLANFVHVTIDYPESLDIDTELDFQLADLLMQERLHPPGG